MYLCLYLLYTMSAGATANLAGTESIEATAPQVVISPIQVPSDTSGAAIAALKTVNNIDTYHYVNFRLLTTLTWTTSDLPGTKLFTLEVKPSSFDYFHQYLSKMFMAWVGDYQYAINVAGTGFNGGKLWLGLLPPYIDPNTVNQATATAFEGVLLDPKTLMSVSLEQMDVNRTAFHLNFPRTYTGETPLNMADQSGGHFFIMVFNQLVASSAENSSLSVNVFFKLAPNFKFVRTIPPQMPQTPDLVYPDLFDDTSYLCTFNTVKASFLRIAKDSIVSNHLECRAGLTGESDDKFPPVVAVVNCKHPEIDLKVGDKGFSCNECYAVQLANGDYKLINKDFLMHSKLDYATLTFARSTLNDVQITSCDLYDRSVICEEQQVQSQIKGYSLLPIEFATNSWTGTLSWTDHLIANFNESIVTFNFDNADFAGFPATVNIIQKCYSGMFSGLPNDSTPVFTVIDRITSDVLLYLRLNRAGFLSTTTQTTSLVLDLKSIRFEFFSVIKSSQRLPILSTTQQVYLWALSSRNQLPSPPPAALQKRRKKKPAESESSYEQV
nr:hypothetical protein [Psittacine picornavirus]